MHVSSRSIRIPAARGVCDRPRHWSGRGSQPGPSSAPFLVGHVGVARRFLSDRRAPGHRRTYVRRVVVRSDAPGAGGTAVTGEFRTTTPTAHPSTASSRVNRLIVWYQRATEGRPSPCRFTPSCSAYALEALADHGTWRGLRLTVLRLVRCRPFGPSGWDPVPEAMPCAHVRLAPRK